VGRVREAAEPTIDEEPEALRGRRRRRVLRWSVVLAVGILAVLAVWQDPLYALAAR
jgi:ferric-dicitrate binding protein FerR (iron transport regulator)